MVPFCELLLKVLRSPPGCPDYPTGPYVEWGISLSNALFIFCWNHFLFVMNGLKRVIKRTFLISIVVGLIIFVLAGLSIYSFFIGMQFSIGLWIVLILYHVVYKAMGVKPVAKTKKPDY